MSCDVIDLTVLLGIANPTPSFPPESLSICELTPITFPLASSSGPPELPWLIAASVWMALVIGWLSGDWMVRPVALTMPAVSESARPNGLPIANTPWPVCTVDESPSVSGVRVVADGSTLITARSVSASLPTRVAFVVVPFWNLTVIAVAPSTT